VLDTANSYWNEGDLHKHMTTARRKFMPVKEIARYMVQLLRGLAHLHKHKVVHCDVSPQNVFLRRDREVHFLALQSVCMGWPRDRFLARNTMCTA
jgi:serine/threonine protein kinase